jgi:hypothetical protein
MSVNVAHSLVEEAQSEIETSNSLEFKSPLLISLENRVKAVVNQLQQLLHITEKGLTEIDIPEING